MRSEISTTADCQDCVTTATKEIASRCPKERVAIIWYDECMLRYGDQSFFSTMDETPAAYLWNPKNITEPTRFQQLVRETMDELATRASNYENYHFVKGFATIEANFTSLQRLYSLVQCTPNLSGTDCNRCLRGAIVLLPRCCDGLQGGRILMPSCNVRYEVLPFYRIIATALPPAPVLLPPPPPPPPPSSSIRRKGKGKISSQTVVAIVTPIGVFLVLVGICYSFLVMKARKKRDDSQEKIAMHETSTVESLQYEFGTIKIATDYFADTNKLGQGGFGVVYKGKLQNGQEIAVKRLSRDSGQGELEFKNEVLLMAKLHHNSLVRLLGFCVEGTERLLIYEFVPNASLDHFIFDTVKRAYLDWDMRYKIIVDIARGLLYLHQDSQLRIIHRDLKASYILLDANMNPKISDFGMARLFPLDETHGNTRNVVGTYGYVAPKYATHGKFSVKSDVFNFGVLILEIISGQKSNGFRNGKNGENLSSYAWKHWREGTALNLIDSSLRANSISLHEIMRCIHIGLLCVQENVAKRPSMASVVLMLNSFSLSLSKPSTPAFLIYRSVDPELTPARQSKNKSTLSSVNEVSISELCPR